MKKHGSDTIESASEEFVEVAGTRQPVPKIDVNPGPQYADENRRFTNVTTITNTPGGRLWAGFSGGGDGEGPIRTDHVVVWTAPDDKDRCWTAPRKLVDEQNMLNQPTVLGDSTWIFPTGCWIRCDDICIKESRERFPSRPLISRDQGKTFELGGPLHGDDPPDYDEYTLAERKDGTLVIYNRYGNKDENKRSILECESRDQGRSWTPIRVKHGTMEWVSAEAFRGRSHMTAWLSGDEGKTWEGGLMLDERDCAYPSGFRADDGTIYVSYDRKRKEQAEMLLARFAEEDAFAGKGVSERFALRLLINRTHGIAGN